MLTQVRNTSEYNCRSLKEQLFCPQDASPSGSRFLPLLCPVLSHMWLPQNLNLQAQYHFKILKSIPAAAPSLPTTSVTQSWGFNTECPPHTQLCGPVICTKMSCYSGVSFMAIQMQRTSSNSGMTSLCFLLPIY